MLWDGDARSVEDEELDETTVGHIMDPIGPSKLVSSETSILDLVALFAGKTCHTYYVLHRNEVIGAVQYDDLFKPIGRLAFLALALEIEDQALRLCQSYSVRASCWKSISDTRRRKAIELFKERYGRSPRRKYKLFDHGGPDSPKLIACTNLIDKATMIWKQKLIASVTRADVLGFFYKLQEMRNKCAHPGQHDALLPKENLANFVVSAFKMRDSLRKAMQVHGA